MGMQALEHDRRTTHKKRSCPIRSLNTEMFAEVIEVAAQDHKDFIEVVSHFCGAMDLNSADDIDDCFCLV